MALPAYTKRFLSAGFPGGDPTLSALVPAGFRWVIRNITVRVRSPGSAPLTVDILGQTTIYVCDTSSPNFYQSLDTHIVMEAGEQLQAYMDSVTGAIDLQISGWELSVTG
jgi:hypothetical protein